MGKPPSDDRPHGVFATRSPRRPNPIGLTVVELLGREGPVLRVRGIDMLDGTPILDIKPYLAKVRRSEKGRRGPKLSDSLLPIVGRRHADFLVLI